MSALDIRTATPADAAEIARLYEPYVRHTAITFDYDPPSVRTFASRIASTLKRYPYLVASDGGRVVGYAYAGVFKDRAAYDWSCETTIYVERSARRQGIGAALYQELERLLRAQGILNLYACVAYPPGPDDPYLTLDSVRFHERRGFATIGHFHRCGYKFGRWYDMVWMEKLIGEHATAQPPHVFCPKQ